MAAHFPMAARIAKVPRTNVWTEFTPMAIAHGAVNLGQGFPTFTPDEFVRAEAAKAVTSEDAMVNQYCRSQGHPELVQYLQQRYSNLLGRDISMQEIEVTNGTTQALNITFQALIEPGDEVIIFEPFFDLYPYDIEMAGGVVKYVPMHPRGTTANEWEVDWEELEAATSPKTKAIVFNSPQNVPGKVWTKAEMERIAAFSKKHDLFVISDEVYDRLVYDGCEHQAIAALPGMYERTLTMASCGKTLSTTGWKVGWIVAPPELCAAVHNVQTCQSFSICTPLQLAAARSLKAATTNGYFDDLPKRYVARRAQLGDILNGVGLTPTMPQGSFFMLADISGVDQSVYVDRECTDDIGLDWHFCRWMTKTLGVTAIPTTAFCRNESRPLFQKYVRFAFCKTEDSIAEAGRRLQKLRDHTSA